MPSIHSRDRTLRHSIGPEPTACCVKADWQEAEETYTAQKAAAEKARTEEAYLRQSIEDLDALNPQENEEEELHPRLHPWLHLRSHLARFFFDD